MKFHSPLFFALWVLPWSALLSAPLHWQGDLKSGYGHSAMWETTYTIKGNLAEISDDKNTSLVFNAASESIQVRTTKRSDGLTAIRIRIVGINANQSSLKISATDRDGRSVDLSSARPGSADWSVQPIDGQNGWTWQESGWLFSSKLPDNAPAEVISKSGRTQIELPWPESADQLVVAILRERGAAHLYVEPLKAAPLAAVP
jgi:hypothetical protein